MDTITKNKDKRFLITTADERTWRTNRPVLFLGDWCRLYARRSFWGKMDAMIVPYHWNDPLKVHKDVCYLRTFYEKLLIELSEALNHFHKVIYSRRYWRILIGPWLYYFTNILFDRWTMILRATHDFEIGSSAMLDLTPDQSIPTDMKDFFGKVFDDPWNSFIYGQILTNWTNVSCEKIVVAQPKKSEFDNFRPAGTPRKSLYRRLRSAVAKKLFCSNFLGRQTDAFFISTYLPFSTDFRLQIALGQAPKLNKSPSLNVTHPKLLDRERLILAKPEGKDFEHCVRSLIPRQIPTLYLEGFQKLQEHVNRLSWPKKPKLIFTSNNFHGDDIFKAWAGSKIGTGSRIITGQHGGLYGTGLWNCNEEHEIQISDRYLTWGWDSDDPKIYPAAALKLVGKSSSKWNPEGSLLLMSHLLSRYSTVPYSGRFASALSDYFEDQFRFVEKLPSQLRRSLIVRLFYGLDFGWSVSSRWKDRYPDIRLDNSNYSIHHHLIIRCRLVVDTYNGATFLETLGTNIPTVIFWNPNFTRLRSSAVPYFERLKEVGIFHESPESAAAKITEVWDDVTGWWNQPYIQEARRYFCNRFAKMPKKPIRVLREALTSVGNSNKS